MPLEERTIVDKIEVVLNGCILIRKRNQILKDGVEVAATYTRHSRFPGEDVSNEDPRVAAIAAATWTDEVVAAFQASQTPAE